MGQGLGSVTCPGEPTIPPGVCLEDGVTEKEAVALALWNNASYQALLAELGISRAQLLDAGLLTDPRFVLYFPLGPKQLELTVYQAMDDIWLRPVRVRAARLDLCRVADEMVQHGLDLIRDVRIAHAQLLLAQQRSQLAVEAADLRSAIADLGKCRLRAGDISELEAKTTQIDALSAEADSLRFAQNVVLARDRLKNLTGLGFDEQAIVAVSSSTAQTASLSVEELVATALAARPDLRAAQLVVDAANQTLSLSRRQFTRIEGVFDANSRGKKGFEAGPGMTFTLPLFNRNRGRIALAEARLEQVTRQQMALRDRISLEVRTAYTRLQQASQDLDSVKIQLLPALQQAQGLARKSYQNGGASYFLVLQTTGQFLDARRRELELTADVSCATAELDRSVGQRVVPGTDILERVELVLAEEPSQ